jgi:EmrB/QacA subfamily drug resistance transporter
MTTATRGRSCRAQATPAGAQGSGLRWLAAAVLITGALMDLIDVTIVNVALPTIRRSLSASATELEWVVSGYLLAFAAILIIAGSLGDSFGRKRIFLLGVAMFGGASLGAGLSVTAAELIAARVVQGAGAAVMSPQVLATFRVIFSGRERGRAFALYGGMAGLATAIGLVLGGVLTDANLFGWSWRAVFFVNVPVALVTLAAGIWVVPPTRDPSAGRPNLPAAAVLAGGLVAIVYPLLEGRQLGWPAWTWPLMAVGVAAIVVLAALEACGPTATRVPVPSDASTAPLLRPRLFRIPAVAAGLGVLVAFAVGMQGFFLMLALWLQAGQHFSPLKAGLTALAFSAGSLLLAPAAVPLALRYGRRVLVLGGAAMAAGTAAVLAVVGEVGVDGSPWPVVPGLAVAGCGLALLVIPLGNVVLTAVPVDAAGGASGLFSTAQQLGGAIGVAVAGTIFFGWVASGHTFAAAMTRGAPYAIGAFALCAALALLLPRTAVADSLPSLGSERGCDASAGGPAGRRQGASHGDHHSGERQAGDLPPAVDVDDAGGQRGSGLARHDRHQRVLQGYPYRDGDQAGEQPYSGDPAHHHRDGLPRSHADRLEHPEVMHLFPGLQHDRVEHAKGGDNSEQQDQQRDEAENERQAAPGSVDGHHVRRS